MVPTPRDRWTRFWTFAGRVTAVLGAMTIVGLIFESGRLVGRLETVEERYRSLEEKYDAMLERVQELDRKVDTRIPEAKLAACEAIGRQFDPKTLTCSGTAG